VKDAIAQGRLFIQRVCSLSARLAAFVLQCQRAPRHWRPPSMAMQSPVMKDALLEHLAAENKERRDEVVVVVDVAGGVGWGGVGWG
jgi:hypothetical protein